MAHTPYQSDAELIAELNGQVYDLTEEVKALQAAARNRERLVAQLAVALGVAAGEYVQPTMRQRNAWMKLVLKARQ